MRKPVNHDVVLDSSTRISRPRAIRLLQLLLRAKEVVIQSHDEPDTLRAVYQSDFIERMLNDSSPEKFDPIGRIRWLRDVDEAFRELGIEP